MSVYKIEVRLDSRPYQLVYMLGAQNLLGEDRADEALEFDSFVIAFSTYKSLDKEFFRLIGFTGADHVFHVRLMLVKDSFGITSPKPHNYRYHTIEVGKKVLATKIVSYGDA